MIYTKIDGEWHVQQELSDHTTETTCGLTPEIRGEWTRKEPLADRCEACFPVDQPDPVAAPAKKKA